LAFNVLIAVIPLLLFVVGVSGFFLGGQLEVIAARTVEFFLFFLPTARGGDPVLTDRVRGLLGAIVEERAGFSASAPWHSSGFRRD
jgi:hypothetical protein